MRISDERLAELIALYAKEQEDAKPWVGEASVEADVHAALMEFDALRRPAHDDDVLSVIVKDLRELQQPWAAVDVDDRNALAAKWRALMRRPVVQSDEVETIRALLAKHYYPSEPGKAYRTLLSALDAAQREIQQLNSKCSQLEINIGSAISENQNTASRFHHETSLLMEARKRIAELQRVPEERKEIAERQETRHKYSMSGWTFFQNCSHRSAIEDIDALLQDAARYRNAHDVLMAERNGMASRIQQLQSDFEFLERAKQLISDKGAQRSRDLATVMHERNGMVGRIERLEGACKRTLEWAKGRMPCKDGECCAELRSEIEALSVALAAADGQQTESAEGKHECPQCGVKFSTLQHWSFHTEECDELRPDQQPSGTGDGSFLGMKVIVNPSMPADELEIRSGSNSVRVVNIGTGDGVATGCHNCGSTPVARERGRCEECGSYPDGVAGE